MRVEILAIGDELLTGTLVDTNSAYIAEHCEQMGLKVVRHSCVGDDLDAMVAALKEIETRADIGIVTGGLGPTLDDLTREAAARAAGVALQLSAQALTAIENYFSGRKRIMPESNKRQAYFPEQAEYLANPLGTAPAFSVPIGQAHCFFMPGVPKEMRYLLQQEVLPRIALQAKVPLERLMIKTLSSFGLPEATVGEHLEVIEPLHPNVKLGTRVFFPETQIKLYARGNDLQALYAAEQAVVARLGDWIFSFEGMPIEQVVYDLLAQQQATISFVEVETGGALADSFTNFPESTPVFCSSTVMKLEQLSALKLNHPTALSAALAKALACKFREQNQSTYVLCILGATSEAEAQKAAVPLGTVFIAIADATGVNCASSCLFFGDKFYKKRLFVVLALDLLRRQILNKAPLSEFLGSPVTYNC